MSDDTALLDALRALRTALSPVAPLPEWVPLDVEAQRRGKTTGTLRDWCLARGVEIRQSSHRDAWVRPSDIDRAVAGLPVATRTLSKAPKSDNDADIDAELNKRTG